MKSVFCQNKCMSMLTGQTSAGVFWSLVRRGGYARHRSLRTPTDLRREESPPAGESRKDGHAGEHERMVVNRPGAS